MIEFKVMLIIFLFINIALYISMIRTMIGISCDIWTMRKELELIYNEVDGKSRRRIDKPSGRKE